MVLGFVVPLTHPQAARSWPAVLARLCETANSLAHCAASGQAFTVLVANNEAKLPSLPDSIQVQRTYLRAPQISVFKGDTPEATRRQVKQLDKGTKVVLGAMKARDLGAHHIMVVDADDLVSSRLPEFVAEYQDEVGWYVKEGWVLPVGGRYAFLEQSFDALCGTCHVVRSDLLDIPERVSDLEPELIRRRFGSHKFIRGDLSVTGHDLSPCPFPAAVYRIAHGENNLSNKSLMGQYFSFASLRKDPLKYVSKLRRIHRFGKDKRQEFIGAHQLD